MKLGRRIAGRNITLCSFIFLCFISTVLGRIILKSFTETYQKTARPLFERLKTISVGTHFDFYDPWVEMEKVEVTFILHYQDQDTLKWYQHIPGMPKAAYPLSSETSMSFPTVGLTDERSQLSLRRHMQLHRTLITDATVTENSFHILLPNFSIGTSAFMVAKICPYIISESGSRVASPCSPTFSYIPFEGTCIVSEGNTTHYVKFGSLSPAHEAFVVTSCHNPVLFHPYCALPTTNVGTYRFDGFTGPLDPTLNCRDHLTCGNLNHDGTTGTTHPLLDAYMKESVVIHLNGEYLPPSATGLDAFLHVLQYQIDHPSHDETIIGTVREPTFMHPDLAFDVSSRLLPLPSENEFIKQWRKTPSGLPIASSAVITNHVTTDRNNTKWETSTGLNPYLVAYGMLRCTNLLYPNTPLWEGTLNIVTHRTSTGGVGQFVSPQHNCIIDGPEEARKYGRRIIPGPDVAPVTGPLRAFYPRGIFAIPEIALIRLGSARFTCIDGFVPARDVNPTEDTVLCQPTSGTTRGQWNQLGRPRLVGHTNFRCVPDVPTCSLDDLTDVDPTILSALTLVRDIIYYEGDYLQFLSKPNETAGGSWALPSFRTEFGLNAPPQCRVDGDRKPYWFWKRTPTKFSNLATFSALLDPSPYPQTCRTEMLAKGTSVQEYNGKVSFPLRTDSYGKVLELNTIKVACSNPLVGTLQTLPFTSTVHASAVGTQFNDANLLCGELVLQQEVSFSKFHVNVSALSQISSLYLEITGCGFGYVLNPMYYISTLPQNTLRLQCDERQLFWKAQTYSAGSTVPITGSKSLPFAPSSTSICIPDPVSDDGITQALSSGGRNPLNAVPNFSINDFTCTAEENHDGATLFAAVPMRCAAYLGLSQAKFESLNSVNSINEDSQDVQKKAAQGTFPFFPQANLVIQKKQHSDEEIRRNLGFTTSAISLDPKDHPRSFLGLNSRSFKVEFYSLLQSAVRVTSTTPFSALPSQFVAGRLGKTRANRFDEFYFDPISGAWENPYRIQLSDLSLRHGTTFCPIESLHGLHLPEFDRTDATDTFYSYGSTIYTTELPQHGLPKDGLLIIAPKLPYLNPAGTPPLLSYHQGKFGIADKHAFRCQADGTLGVSPTILPTFSRLLKSSACSLNSVIKTTYSNPDGSVQVDVNGHTLAEYLDNEDGLGLVTSGSSSLAPFSIGDNYPGLAVGPEALQCIHWGAIVAQQPSSVPLSPSPRLGGRIMPRYPDRSVGGSLYLGLECTPDGWRYRRPDLQRSVLSPLVIRSLVDPALPYNRASRGLQRMNTPTSQTMFPRGADRKETLNGSSNFHSLFHCLSFNSFAAPEIKDMFWVGRKLINTPQQFLHRFSKEIDFESRKMVVIPHSSFTFAIAAGDKSDFGLSLTEYPPLFVLPHRLTMTTVTCNSGGPSAECEPGTHTRNAYYPPASIIQLYPEASDPSLEANLTSLTTLLRKNGESAVGVTRGCRIRQATGLTQSLTYSYPSSSTLSVFVPRPFTTVTTPNYAIPSSTFFAAECANHRGYLPRPGFSSTPIPSPLPTLGCFYTIPDGGSATGSQGDQALLDAKWYVVEGLNRSVLDTDNHPCYRPSLKFFSSSGTFSPNLPLYTELGTHVARKSQSLWLSIASPTETSYDIGRRLGITFSMKKTLSAEGEENQTFTRPDWSFVNPLLAATPWLYSNEVPHAKLEVRYGIEFHPFADMFLPTIIFSNAARAIFLHASDIKSTITTAGSFSPEIYLLTSYVRTCSSYLPADFSFSLTDAQANTVDARSYVALKNRPDCVYCSRHIVEPDGGSMVAEIAHGDPLSRLIRRRAWEIFPLEGTEPEGKLPGDNIAYNRPFGSVATCEDTLHLHPVFGDATIAGQSIAPSKTLPRGGLCNAEGLVGTDFAPHYTPISGLEPSYGDTYNVKKTGSNMDLNMNNYTPMAIDVLAPCLPSLVFYRSHGDYGVSTTCARSFTIDDAQLLLPARFLMQRYISQGVMEKDLPLDFPAGDIESRQHAFHISSILPGADVSFFQDIVIDTNDVMFHNPRRPHTLRIPVRGEDIPSIISFNPVNTLMVTFHGATDEMTASALKFSRPYDTVSGLEEFLNLWVYENEENFRPKGYVPQSIVRFSLGLSVKFNRNAARALPVSRFPSRHLISSSIPVSTFEGSFNNVLDTPFWRSPMRHAKSYVNQLDSSRLELYVQTFAPELKGQVTGLESVNTFHPNWKQSQDSIVIPFQGGNDTENNTFITSTFSINVPFVLNACKKHPFLAKYYNIASTTPKFGDFRLRVTGPQVVCNLSTNLKQITSLSPLSLEVDAKVTNCFDSLDGATLGLVFVPNSAYSIQAGNLLDFHPSVSFRQFTRSTLYSLVTLVLSFVPRLHFPINEVPSSAYAPYLLSESTPTQINLADLSPAALQPGAPPLFEFHFSFSYYSSPWVQVDTPRDRFVHSNDLRRTYTFGVESTCSEKNGSAVDISSFGPLFVEYYDSELFLYIGISPKVAEIVSGDLERTCTFVVKLTLVNKLEHEEKTTYKTATVVFSRTPSSLSSPVLTISPVTTPVTVSGATLSPGFSGTFSEVVSAPLTDLGLFQVQKSVEKLEGYTPGSSKSPTKALVAVVSQLSTFSLSLTLKVAPTSEYKGYQLGIFYPSDQDVPNTGIFFDSLYKQTSKEVRKGSTEIELTFQFTAQRNESVISQRKHVSGLLLFHAKIQSRDNPSQVYYITEAIMIIAVAAPSILPSIDRLTQEEVNKIWERSNPLYLHSIPKISFVDTTKSLTELRPEFITDFSAALPGQYDNEGMRKTPVKVYVGDSSTSRVFTKTMALDQKEPFVIGVCERSVKFTTVVQDFLGVTSTILFSLPVDPLVENHINFELTCPKIATLSPTLLPSPAILSAYFTASKETTTLVETALTSDLCALSISETWTVVSLALSTLNSFDQYTQLAWMISLPANANPTSPGYPNGTELYDRSSESYLAAHTLLNRVISSIETLGLKTCFTDTIALREFSSTWATNISPPRKASSFMTSLKGWALKHARLADAAQRQQHVQELLSTFDVMSRSLGVNDQAPIFAMQNVVSNLDMAMDALSQLLKNSESKEIVRLHLRSNHKIMTDNMTIMEAESESKDLLIQESRTLLNSTMTLLSSISSVAFLGVDTTNSDAFLSPSTDVEAAGGVVDMNVLPQFTQTGSNLHVSLKFLPKNLTFTSLNDSTTGDQQPSSVQIPGSVLNDVTQSRNVISSFFSLSNAELGRAALGRDSHQASGNSQPSLALGVVSLSLLDGQTGAPIDITQRSLYQSQDYTFGTRAIPKVRDIDESEKSWFFIEIPFSRDTNNGDSLTTVSAASRCVYTEDMAALAADSAQEWEHNDSCQLHEITASSVVCRCTHLTFFSVRFSAQSFVPRFQEITMDQIRQVNWANVTRNLVPVIILLVWPLLTILVMIFTRRLDIRYYRQGIEKLLLDWNIREQRPVTKKEVYKVTNSDSVFYIIWRRYWYAIRDTHIWFSVFMRQTTHNYSSMSRALTGMVLMLSSFTLSGVFSGYTNQGFITVVIMTSACLFVISELLRFVFDRAEKDRIKRFIYYYSESLVYFYFTGKSMLFSVSEHESLMQQRPAILVEKGGAELSSLVLSLGWEAVPMGAIHAHINRDVPLQESRTVFDKQIVRQYAIGDVDTFYYRARDHEYKLSSKEAAEIHYIIRRALPQTALSANDISNKFHNQPLLDLFPSVVRFIGLSLVGVWIIACYFLVVVNASALASNGDASVTQSPVSDWVTSAGLSLLLDLFVTSFALGFVKSTGFYCLSYMTKCCRCRQHAKFYGSDDSLKVNAMPDINTYRRLTYFEPLTDVEMTNFNCTELKTTEITTQSNAVAKIFELADKPDEDDINEDDNFGATDDVQFSAQLNRVGPSMSIPLAYPSPSASTK